MRELLQDLRLAARRLRATPLFTALVAASLTLGLGANAAVFGLVNSLLLKPLPVFEPDRLVQLSTQASRGGGVFSRAVFEQVRQQRDLHDGALAYACCHPGTLTRGAVDEPLDEMLTSGDYFRTLGLRPYLGRLLEPADDVRGGSADGLTGVISYGLWRRLGADASIVGRTITIDNTPVVIVGVAPPAFRGLDVGRSFDVALPIHAQAVLDPAKPLTDAVEFLNVWLRLRPGATPQSAADTLRRVQPQIRAAAMPDPPPSANWLSDPFTLQPAAFGSSILRARFAQPLIAMLTLLALVLLVACANLSNLLLARGLARRHELAIRRSLGATRWLLIRQSLVETTLITATGAAGGFLFAAWAGELLARQFSTATRPVSLDLSPDWRVLAFVALASVLTALVSGVAPAVRATRIGGGPPLDGRRVASAVDGRISAWPTIAQTAISVVLVIAAGLFVRTFERLSTASLGFDRNSTVIATVTPTTVPAGERNPLYHRLVAAAAAVPGVEHAGGSLNPPLVGTVGGAFVVSPSGSAAPPDAERITQFMDVTPGWFAAAGTPLLAGRDFADRDTTSAPPVMIVNQAFAQKILRRADAVGTTVALSSRFAPLGDIRLGDKTIVGMVADAAFRSARDAGRPTVYLPLGQRRGPLLFDSFFVALRPTTATVPLRAIADAMKRVNPNLTVRFTPVASQVRDALAEDRVLAVLAGFLGMLALLLAALGLYGVTALDVTRQRRDIGVRLALGATRGSVVRLVMTAVSLRMAVGVALGLMGSLWASTLTASLLYGLEPRDPLTFAAAAGALTAVGLQAAWMVARRAARLDPHALLREG